MDDKLFINEVKKYEMLYIVPKGYRKKRKINLAWKEISKKFNVSVRFCVYKWKNLKHRFYRIHQRSKVSENSLEIQAKWDLYDDLLFLKDYMEEESPKDPIAVYDDENHTKQENHSSFLRSTANVSSQASKTPDDIDVELIEEVGKCPLLWNKKHCNYFATKIRAQTWNDIGQKLNIPATMAKKRWRVLRDHFVRDFNRNLSLASASPSQNTVVVWELYERMLFLKDFIDTDMIITLKSNEKHLALDDEEDTFEPKEEPELEHIDIINEVKKYECLLTNMPNGKLRRAIAWNKISKKLKTPALILTKKWRYLRNRFLKEYNKNPNSSDWKLFNDLLFLKVYLKRKDDDLIDEDDSTAINNELEGRNLVLVEDNTSGPSKLKPFMKKNAFYERLIEEVKKYEAIYNPKCKDHKNNFFIRSIWQEISVTLNQPVQKCRSRWQYLRDRFIKEYSYYEKYGHLDEFYWEFFDDLLFLKDYIEVRRRMLLKKASTAYAEKLNKERYDSTTDKNTVKAYWDEIDCFELIKEVEKRPELYAKMYSKRTHHEKRKKIWEAIARKLKHPSKYCKVKWKGLRKRYINECRRFATNKKICDDVTIEWPYFNEIKFLKPHIQLDSFQDDNPTSLEFSESQSESAYDEDGCEENLEIEPNYSEEDPSNQEDHSNTPQSESEPNDIDIEFLQDFNEILESKSLIEKEISSKYQSKLKKNPKTSLKRKYIQNTVYSDESEGNYESCDLDLKKKLRQDCDLINRWDFRNKKAELYHGEQDYQIQETGDDEENDMVSLEDSDSSVGTPLEEISEVNIESDFDSVYLKESLQEDINPDLKDFEFVPAKGSPHQNFLNQEEIQNESQLTSKQGRRKYPIQETANSVQVNKGFIQVPDVKRSRKQTDVLNNFETSEESTPSFNNPSQTFKEFPNEEISLDFQNLPSTTNNSSINHHSARKSLASSSQENIPHVKQPKEPLIVTTSYSEGAVEALPPNLSLKAISRTNERLSTQTTSETSQKIEETNNSLGGKTIFIASANEKNGLDHLPFLQMVNSKLNALPTDDQEDVKMLFLNYLHERIRKQSET